MTLTEEVAKKIIRKLLKGQDYRIEIVTLINAEFLQYVIEFFKKIVAAKLRDENIDMEWYKREFLDESLPKVEYAVNSGLNMKTISNMFNSTARQIVIDASKEHFEKLYESIESLIGQENEVDIKLTIKFRDVSVDLNVSESLIVINTLAVKRSALRGAWWSTAGKRVEKPLMETLCRLYNVSEDNFKINVKSQRSTEFQFQREVDYYLLDDESQYKCEVKLMGKGNPESADAVIARGSKVFVADKLSDTNKSQLDSLDVYWVELRAENGFQKFKNVLERLHIPHGDLPSNIDEKIEEIFRQIFV
jgi:hypothetical protein